MDSNVGDMKGAVIDEDLNAEEVGLRLAGRISGMEKAATATGDIPVARLGKTAHSVHLLWVKFVDGEVSGG
ncbi:UNVERIFIED_CONTAM: hypothetical protein PYX00_007460 [Menopon gallinae]|uniref:Uncharacterized protein n=1 Tax=Menopon gallinae TaxID=328185 RepID=A0AAW2HJT2_9NEOP